MTRDKNNIRKFTEQDLEGVRIVLCLRDTGMALSEIKRYMDLCTKGIETLPERLEIIQEQKKRAYEELEVYKKKIEHLEEKERFYLNAIETGVEDDSCNPIIH